MHPRCGISPDVGQELDALTTQQTDELLKRAGRMAYGPDDAGSHPRWTLARAIGSATDAWLSRSARALVALPADLGAGFTDQEIEVDALIRLGHGLAIELDPAAIGMRLGWLPFRFAPCELGIGDVQMDSPPGDVELDHVAVLDQRQRSTVGRFGRGVQHHRSVGGARHP